LSADSPAEVSNLQNILTAPGFEGVISAAESAELQRKENLPLPELLRKLVPMARTFSRPPISNYPVGAVCVGETGAIYFGTNFEIPEHPLNMSVHGEQCAFTNAFMHNETRITHVVTSAPPCGHCRQFMNEFAAGGPLTMLVEGEKFDLQDLLPLNFGPQHLGNTGGVFSTEKLKLQALDTADQLVKTAWQAAAHSYAPYSKSPSGVGLRLNNGTVCSGSYIENVAFNPSLSPVHAAFVQLVLSGVEFDQVNEVVLVEVEQAAVSQEGLMRSVLAVIAPSAKLSAVRTKLQH
jgi:cytidine deaminase